MAYLLFGISNQMAAKGFCVPEEFDDGEDGEGDGQDGDGGMGLSDDVTGTKDVSDRIESEDQLEDAKRAEDYEKEKEETDDKCEEVEGGIEMNDDFEGELQDVNKEGDEEKDSDDEKDDDDDAEKQMGETGAESEQLDSRIWGDEHEEENDDDVDDAEEANQGDDTNEDSEETLKETEGKSDSNKDLAARTNDQEGDEQDSEETGEQQLEKPDINELKEPEFDEDQINPHHGKDKPLPEPEEFDIPEEMNLDDGNKDNEEEGGDDENPFDVDKIKENLPEITEDKDEVPDPTADKVEEAEESGEDEDQTQLNVVPGEEEETRNKEQEEPEEKIGGGEENEDEEKSTPAEESLKDKKSSVEENIEQSNEKKGTDNVQTSEPADDKQSKPEDSSTQIDDSKDEKGVGQAKTEESQAGHSGEKKESSDSAAKSDTQKPFEQRQKPGDVDSERSLGNTNEDIKKNLRSDDRSKEESQTIEDESMEEKQQKRESDHYQHIKETKNHDAQILDAATKEQVEEQQLIKDQEDPKATELETDDVDVMEIDKEENDEQVPTEILEAEKIELSEKKKKSDKRNKGDEMESEMEMQIEGDIVETQTVARGNETTYHTQVLDFDHKNIQKLTPSEEYEMRLALREKLSEWTAEPPSDSEAKSVWSAYSTLTSSLSHDLCEQLRLILEPTQTSRLKGDYRTGRRINMRKVIPYIASQFRKDKIWLRRTKPSKREYQIVIAIDDSQSMLVNQANQLAFESVALLSSALTLLESGQIGVLSFGEKVDILHRLSDQFTEDSGARILQSFSFEQKKTLVENMVNFTCDMFKEVGETSHSSTSPNNAKLLVIISDGRGIRKEAIQTVRRARNEKIFMVFIIIDNPNAKDSILDMRRTNFDEVTNKFLGITPYLEEFPFPYYVILRDINQLPRVLSDALRQWFELVTETS